MFTKRFYPILLVMMMALSLSAGVPPGGATGAEAADETSAQQAQKSAATPGFKEPLTRPIPEKARLKMEKISQKLEKHQQKSSLRDGNGVHHPTTVPLLTVGLVLILVGLLLFFLPGLGALGSLCVSVGAILCIVALILYLV